MENSPNYRRFFNPREAELELGSIRRSICQEAIKNTNAAIELQQAQSQRFEINPKIKLFENRVGQFKEAVLSAIGSGILNNYSDTEKAAVSDTPNTVQSQPSGQEEPAPSLDIWELDAIRKRVEAAQEVVEESTSRFREAA